MPWPKLLDQAILGAAGGKNHAIRARDPPPSSPHTLWNHMSDILEVPRAPRAHHITEELRMHMQNRTSICTLVALLALLAGCATTSPPGSARSGARPVRSEAADSTSAHRAGVGFLAAFDSLQWEPFRAYLAEDVTMFFPFPQFPGRADGREAVERVFSRFMESQREARTRAGRPLVQGLAPRDLRVQMLGPGGAVVTFHLGGESPARRSLVFRRTAGDAWKVVHWHASPPPQPAGS
jgi:ketosteroid isomerase-like protein